MKQSNAYTHKIAMGSALCSACVAPMMLLVALMSIYNRQDVGGMLGCVGMFGMIGMGIYCLVTAKKPKNRDQIRNGRFSLSAALRKKLMKLKELTDEKSRRKKGMGSTLLATCCVPIFIGAALDSMWYVYNDPFAILGVGAMFLMIGAGVYEVVVASGEKKPLKDLLKERLRLRLKLRQGLKAPAPLLRFASQNGRGKDCLGSLYREAIKKWEVQEPQVPAGVWGGTPKRPRPHPVSRACACTALGAERKKEWHHP
ncbi:MAG: hypothetical protein ACLTV6_07060 [Christensenellales bacterium]